MKVVINECYGGFSISYEAVMLYAERKGLTLFPHSDEISTNIFGLLEGNEQDYRGLIHYYKVPPEQYHEFSTKWREEDGDYKRINAMDWYFSELDIARDDPDLVAVVDALGHRANRRFSKLVIVDIPDDVEWEIAEYDGFEHVAEKHRTWP